MNPFNLIPGPYQLLAKGIAALALLLALWYAWHQFTGHYIDIGRAEVQRKWDVEKLSDEDALIAAKDARRARESLQAVAAATIDNKLHEDLANENIAKDRTIADLDAGNKRMRSITGKPQTDPGMPIAGPGVSGNNATCTVQLPREIGEPAIGIGAEADKVADRLRACQALLIEDRKTCKWESDSLNR